MDSNKNAIQEFYKDLAATEKKCKSGEMLLVTGDWNAKIGCGVEQLMVGDYGLESRNKQNFAHDCDEALPPPLRSAYATETEALYRFNPKQAHKRIKELKRKKITNSSGIIKDKDGSILFNENG